MDARLLALASVRGQLVAPVRLWLFCMFPVGPLIRRIRPHTLRARRLWDT